MFISLTKIKLITNEEEQRDVAYAKAPATFVNLVCIYDFNRDRSLLRHPYVTVLMSW